MGTRILMAVVALGMALPGQAARYDLGQRTRAMEQAFEAAPPAARARAARDLQTAVQAFFAMNLGKAGAALDAVRHGLAATPPEPVQRFAESLMLAPSGRLLDAASRELTVEWAPAYTRDDQDGVALRARVSLLAEDGQRLGDPVETALNGEGEGRALLPLVDVPPGDHWLRGELFASERCVARHQVRVSVVKDLAARLQAAAPDEGELDLARATWRSLHTQLLKAARGDVLETDLPYARWLAQVEAIAAALRAGKAWQVPQAGEVWLAAPSGRRRVPVRVWLPEGKGERRPLVYALHGAGGSENMFFDAYGAGKVVALAQARGWIVAAPGNVGGAADDVLDALLTALPIDPQRVYVVGHSMGAAHAIAATTGRGKQRYAATAALGGGGSVPAKADLAERPFFVAAGELDFGRGGARGLRRALEGRGAKVLYKEYPDTEHLAIVQVALADVFAWFDALSAGGK